MCAVAAIPFIAMGVSALMSAQQNKQAGEASSAANMQNAAISRIQANDAVDRGEFEADQQRLKTRAAIGTQRAGFAGNGVDVNSGSAALVQDDTAALGELDALTIRNNAAREAWGYNVQADQYIQAAGNAKKSANNAIMGGLVSTGAKAASTYAGGYSGNSSLLTSRA